MGGWWLTPVPGCLGSGLSWFGWWVSIAPEFQCCCFCGSSCLICLRFNFDFYVSKMVRLCAGSLLRRPGGLVSGGPGRSWEARVGRTKSC